MKGGRDERRGNEGRSRMKKRRWMSLAHTTPGMSGPIGELLNEAAILVRVAQARPDTLDYLEAARDKISFRQGGSRWCEQRTGMVGITKRGTRFFIWDFVLRIIQGEPVRADGAGRNTFLAG